MKYLKNLLLILGLFILPASAQAGDCLRDPIYERDWNAKVTTGARVRSIPCMEGSDVLTVLPVGEIVNVIAETDGWYQVKRKDGTKGWVGQWLIEKTSAGFTAIEPLPDLANYRYEEAVRYLYDKKVIQGYSDNTFRADNLINRAEFTKILIESTQDNFDSIKNNYKSDCFEDVAADQWYAPYICYAKKNDIINGYPNGTFLPAKDINLAEALKILVNVFDVEEGDEGENWYDVYVNAMGNKNYIPSTFKNPSQNVTRGEMSEMMWRVLENKKNQDYVKAEDLLSADNSIDSNCQPMGENIPANVDMERVREQWLTWYNEERAALGKYAYVNNPQLHRSATAWAEEMKAKGVMDHKRTGQTEYYDYNMITQWFADLGLVFKNVNRVTHTENIGWGYYSCSESDCTDEVIAMARTSLDFFLSEKNKSYQPHYQSVMSDYFKEIGLGIAFDGTKYYLAVHYGTEITSEPLAVCVD